MPMFGGPGTGPREPGGLLRVEQGSESDAGDDAQPAAGRNTATRGLRVFFGVLAVAALFMGARVFQPRAATPAPAEAGAAEKLWSGASSAAGSAPRLCTDGWVFTFSTSVAFYALAQPIVILQSSTGVLNLTAALEAPYIGATPVPVVSVSLRTFTYGDVSVTSSHLDAAEKYVVTVRKTSEELCIELTNDKGQITTPTCTYPPASMPTKSFQMGPVGELSWGEGYPALVATVGDFIQTTGFVPVTLVLGNVPLADLWTSDSDWDKLNSAMAETLAIASNNSVLPTDVHLTPVAAASPDATLFQASVMARKDNAATACNVEDTLKEDIEGHSNIRETYLNAVTESLVAKAGIAAAKGKVYVEAAQVPGTNMLCSQVQCRKSYRLVEPDGRQNICMGGGCASMCCEDEWSKDPLPYTPSPLAPASLPKAAKGTGHLKAAKFDGFSWSSMATLAASPPAASSSAAAKRSSAGSASSTTEVQKILAKKMTFEEKIDQFKMLKKGASKVKGFIEEKLKKLNPAFSSDGYSFEFRVNYTIRSFAPQQVILYSDFNAIVLRTVALEPLWKKHARRLNAKSLFTGQVEFSTQMLNPHGNDNTGGCKVRTPPLLAPGWYEFVVSRDRDQCCIQARPSRGLLGKIAKKFQEDEDSPLFKAHCASRSDDILPDEWQIAPAEQLHLKENLVVKPCNYEQTKGNLTMSFLVTHVSYADITDEDGCDCEDQVILAIREALAFSMGIGASPDPISVSLKDSFYTEGSTPPPAKMSSPDEKFDIPAVWEKAPGYKEKADKHSAKLHKLLKAAVARTGGGARRLGEDAEEDEGFDMPEAPSRRTPKGRRLFLPWFKKVQKATKNTNPPGAPPPSPVYPAIEVQVIYSGCGACQEEKAALSKGIVGPLVAARVTRAVGSTASGTVTVQDIQIPAKTMSCSDYTCPAYTENAGSHKVCYGSTCEATCCQPVSCSKTTCVSPQVSNMKNHFKTCRGETDCADTCCLVPCKDYTCTGDSICPKEHRWLLVSKPSEVQETCCKEVFPPCCDAPIAACIACLQCMTQAAYCESSLHWWTLGHRRLGEAGASNASALPLGLPHGLRDNDLSGGLPVAELVPEDEATERKRRLIGKALESESEFTWAGEGQAELNTTGMSEAYRMKHRTRRSQRLYQQHRLVAGMLNQVKKAAAFRAKHLGLPHKPSVGLSLAKAWIQKWKDVIAKAKSKRSGMVAGCEGTLQEPCRYHFSNIFLLHRLYDKVPKAANTVQVLTDTRHAVSCGDDGLCWVWKIRGGEPRQVFPDHTGPVKSVSVLFDATFILSAGISADGAGEAFIWDWRNAFQKTDFSCGEPLLSTAEMPAWRLTLLGCQDNFTYVWNWNSGNTAKLPYRARTVEELKGFIASRHTQWVNTVLNGAERLAYENEKSSREFETKLFVASNPDVSAKAEALIKFHDYVHQNRFGAVNAVAYVPTKLRFATGHGDGKVRYWSAATGQLLMVMQGHQGPVNAIAASPKSQKALSGGEDGTVRVWDLKSGIQLMLMYQPYGGPVLSLAVIPGGSRVVVGSQDGYLRIWDISTGILLCSINTGGGGVNGVAVNPSNPLGQILAANADGYVRVFNPR